MDDIFDSNEEYLAGMRKVILELTPAVEPKDIDAEIFLAVRPEKLELIDGRILADSEEGAIALAKMLITNLGLAKVVALASLEMWEKAIKPLK